MPPLDANRAVALAPPAPWRESTLLRALDLAVPCLVLFVIVVSCCVLPFVYPIPEPIGASVRDANLPMFSAGHVLGTDTNGNDVLSRLLHGGRASLTIALAVNGLGLLLGGFLGALAGYVGRTVDSLIMRAFDVMLAFPSLVLVLAVAQVLGPSYSNTIWALAFYGVPAFARIARSAVLRIRGQPFLVAAQLAGVGIPRILVGHIAPNILPQLATFGLLGMGVVICLEGALSYLGLGIQPPEPTWGNMILEGQQSLLTRPSLLLLPSGFLFVTVLSFNLLGETLRTRWEMR